MSPDIAVTRLAHEPRTGGAKEEGDEVRDEGDHPEDARGRCLPVRFQGPASRSGRRRPRRRRGAREQPSAGWRRRERFPSRRPG